MNITKNRENKIAAIVLTLYKLDMLESWTSTQPDIQTFVDCGSYWVDIYHEYVKPYPEDWVILVSKMRKKI